MIYSKDGHFIYLNFDKELMTEPYEYNGRKFVHLRLPEGSKYAGGTVNLEYDRIKESRNNKNQCYIPLMKDWIKTIKLECSAEELAREFEDELKKGFEDRYEESIKKQLKEKPEKKVEENVEENVNDDEEMKERNLFLEAMKKL